MILQALVAAIAVDLVAIQGNKFEIVCLFQITNTLRETPGQVRIVRAKLQQGGHFFKINGYAAVEIVVV